MRQRALTQLNDARARPARLDVVSETVAKRKPASIVSGEQSDRELSSGASRPTGS
jgi:hypothetical protein